ncbi:helix-turn-helix transcriptional regulator [Burkholderia gladioli]|uniref:XRE family transcriptional regulator n=1 Tax=Burkholderia gladioli TaxID=28095 RepID=A0A2A7RZU7_BURGA|nr:MULTISPECIES: helix-turn-helix transcriptional regulator [Burkholderia]MBO7752272.1 helix-turn-helix transcriptional regulator [Burkholderia pseudomallei]MBU9323264.1 helix-turn-helix domain-containing protein [Burkholderia gladioli]MBU9427308.1 helix-turn-helix domain-containing protein [Burkholderia gladioli]MDN8064457.1 helix-turn-helix transcriptional regulator [Burkholderia gladioli]PEH36575.1 XRE family transcriptional regulator [Burkholderia gladioli]
MFPPRSQGELLRWARGTNTQADFAATTGVSKSALSRYEREQLGAPVSLINYCLARMAEALSEQSHTENALEGALENAKRTVLLLEGLTGR